MLFRSLDGYYENGATKTYYLNHTTMGASPETIDLGKYVGKMGTGLIDAAKLLDGIKNKELSSDMKLPNVYVGLDKTVKLNLSLYFDGGTSGFTCTVANAEVAQATAEGNLLSVKGLKAGNTTLTVTSANGKSQTVVVTVRKGAGNNGWL